MNIHEDSSLFDEVVDAAALWKGIRPVYIEKDYWVCKVLKNLAVSEYKEYVVFKGGTSLSKGFGIIERFSEDIDLAIFKKENLSGNQVKNLMRNTIACMTSGLEEDHKDPRMSKRGTFRKIPFKYPHKINVPDDFNLVSENLLIEFNAFANPYPICFQKISSYIYDFLLYKANEVKLINDYDLNPFAIKTLCPKRTLTEKLFAIGKASYRENPVDLLKTGIRHFYDIHMILSNPYFGAFPGSKEFPLYCNKVKEDDHSIANFIVNWDENPLSSAPIFQEPDVLWSKISSAYERDFAGLVFGALPEKEEIERSLKTISNYVVNLSLE